MSFFGKFKSGAASTTGSTTSNNGVKKDQNAKPTALDKHLVDYSDPIRPDGSDKFFGFENYGSTCYANSVIQCLYYSEPFRESVLGFPSSAFLKDWQEKGSQLPEKQENGTLNGTPLPARLASTSVTTPYPNPTSPARKPPGVTTPASPARAEDNKDSPEYKKRMAIQMGPVLDMTQDRSKEYAMEESLFTSLKDIFAAIIANQSRTGVVSPHKFLEILRRENEMFRSAMHQDAHEFLNLLLNSVVENVEHFTKQQKEALTNGTANAAPAELAPDPHWVNDIFEGTLTSETRCLTCETVSQRDEPFLDLSVDLSPFTSVTSCLKKFSQEEMLCERNKFHCDNCGGLQEAEKRMKIKSLPRVLALHLKRFKYTEDLRQLQKLFHKVVYPFHLRLFNTTDDAGDSDRLYELYAVVVHIGGGPYHGHYVSIVKTQDRGWLLFDDELVEPVDKNYVLNFFGGEPVPGVQDARQLACAYVLFYQETTLEAVLKDQDAEQAASRPVSEAVATSPVTDGYKTPGLGEIEQVSPVTPQPLVVPMSPAALGPDIVRSKKELKAEEKDRKAAEKVDAAEKREKEAAEKRTEVLRRQEEQHKRSLAHANISKVTMTTTTTTEVETPTSPVVVEKSGFGRFMRPSSMTLKNRPKMPFMGGGNNDAKDQQEDTLSPMGGLPHGAVANESDLQAGPAVQLPTVDELVREHKEKRNRFGLGKKKSTHFFS